jgi:hypothetical protein
MQFYCLFITKKMTSLFSTLFDPKVEDTAAEAPIPKLSESSKPSAEAASEEATSEAPAEAAPVLEASAETPPATKSIATWFPDIARAVLKEFDCPEAYIEQLKTFSGTSRNIKTVTSSSEQEFKAPENHVCRAVIGHPTHFNILTHLMWLGHVTSEPLINLQREFSLEEPIVASFDSVMTSLLEKEFRVSKDDYLIQTMGFTKTSIKLAVETMLQIGTTALQELLKLGGGPMTTSVLENALEVAKTLQSVVEHKFEDVSLQLCHISQTLVALATLPSMFKLPHGFPKIVTQMRPDAGDYLAKAYFHVFQSHEQWNALMNNFRHELLSYTLKVGLDTLPYFDQGLVSRIIDALNEAALNEAALNES